MTRIPETEPAAPSATVLPSELARPGTTTMTVSFLADIPRLGTLRGAGTSADVSLSPVRSSPATPGAEPLPPRDLEFWLERTAFRMIPSSELAQYEGRYVASVSGRIVESDSSLAALAVKFIRHHGDVAVYMTKIGPEEEERIDTPFE